MNLEDPDLEMIRENARKLADQFGDDYWFEADKHKKYPWEFIKAFGEQGWLGALMPEAYGGMGLGMTEAGVILHEIGESGGGHSGASAFQYFVFPPGPIIHHGSEEMKQKYLPKLATGEMMMCFAVTEPDNGVDTSRIKTFAQRQPDGRWLINGHKIWISNAQNADRALLLTRTSPRDDKRPFDGMTLFFVPLDRNNVEIRPIDKLGRNCIDSNELFIDNLEARDEDIVGEVGKGFRCLLDGLNPERIAVSFAQIGTGRAALAKAVQYAKDRVVFDRPIGKNQAIAHPLADSWMRLEVAEMMAMKAARLFDERKPCGAEANAAKFLATEAAFQAADRAMQTLGGYAYAKEYHVERYWRETRLLKIAPVSQEMVLNFISTKVLDLPRSY
jgi:alkylation response protein AidB-like acyl-CoA dehydrogenase|eukprot:TRINITY_DN9759_c0_g1_i12.p1 TRINITY_DN9759_c0_g1~~TRINITY_DN9759_c0_g1_i12.p1  ORF type:complete len:388 (-),score=112.41 TRINITY_DN9759_c0_g1_i12:57-1220(-)